MHLDPTARPSPRPFDKKRQAFAPKFRMSGPLSRMARIGQTTITLSDKFPILDVGNLSVYARMLPLSYIIPRQIGYFDGRGVG